MSTYPRTNALMEEWSHSPTVKVLLEHAIRLEQDLAALTEASRNLLELSDRHPFRCEGYPDVDEDGYPEGEGYQKFYDSFDVLKKCIDGQQFTAKP